MTLLKCPHCPRRFESIGESAEHVEAAHGEHMEATHGADPGREASA